ncbi:DNA repair protein RecN [Bacillus cereus group sp. TH152-1LC]|uniref:DNA repair protein RecN n=1 Tax=Bacillus cereus group sp. TH152-1LC TaxID=3018060 RepID=UPI0022E93741|nr:DNA repair protein RecN [Bacillus cereus group sp. TH152-1LC]MDA1674725.1 DNA repair protein RecN [Bacillus cereus group sp. TH152-1LC]
MLIQIEIKDFAIIEHSIINFEDGFNVITGETGAGKSILFDALSSIIGERTSKSFVRKGRDKAELKAVFLKTEKMDKLLKERNIESPDDIVIIQRIISANGRSIAKINESIQSTQVIKDMCQDLIEICGQKAHLELLQEDKYLHWVDNHADKHHRDLLHTYQEKYSHYKELRKSIDDLMSKGREQEQLLDLYRFQQKEIEKMNLRIGEDDELEEELRFLNSFEQISSNAKSSIHSLSVIDEIYDAKESLLIASKYDEKLGALSERIESAYYELQDIKGEIESYVGSIEYDEERLNQVIYRLESIKQMKRKYADTIEGILAHLDDVSEKLDTFDNKEEYIIRMQKEEKIMRESLLVLAKELHENRKTIAKKLEINTLKELKELCMPDAVFMFNVETTEDLNEFGYSKVHILFNANKGEDAQALSKIASGGELSRVLLSMKIASNLSEEGKTIVFDEVDEGIGGEVGRHIGQKLYELGTHSQVIAISHLPQVASKGNQHFLIRKSVKDERTVSTVTKLSDEQRVLEIARMIFGDEKNEITIRQAEEMLKK